MYSIRPTRNCQHLWEGRSCPGRGKMIVVVDLWFTSCNYLFRCWSFSITYLLSSFSHNFRSESFWLVWRFSIGNRSFHLQGHTRGLPADHTGPIRLVKENNPLHNFYYRKTRVKLFFFTLLYLIKTLKMYSFLTFTYYNIILVFWKLFRYKIFLPVFAV